MRVLWALTAFLVVRSVAPDSMIPAIAVAGGVVLLYPTVEGLVNSIDSALASFNLGGLIT